MKYFSMLYNRRLLVYNGEYYFPADGNMSEDGTDMEKLYETFPYLRDFEAVVTAAGPGRDGHYMVELDRTAFYPEGGGQPSDVGTLNGIFVLHVSEKDGRVIHETAGPLAVGERVCGEIDWDRRFSNMQSHSGEHLVSGLIHRRFGYDNVGFHMGRDEVTVDFNGVMTQDQMLEIERQANRMIYDNLPLKVMYPSKDELAAMDYRSKKEIEGQVRLVEIPGADLCACCGTHVEKTGEIGLVKLTGMIRYKGGVRISMLCGMRALEDYERRQEQTRQISVLLSAKPETIVDAVERLKAESADKDARLAELGRRLMELKCFALPDSDAPLFAAGDLLPQQLRQYANLLMESGKGSVILAAVPVPSGIQYVLASHSRDVRPLAKELNQRFSGKGGGSAGMVQGNVKGTEREIGEAFLELAAKEGV